MPEPPMAPDLQSCLVCDDVRQERNGKFILIGIFDAIAGPAFPLRYPRLAVVTRWCSGQGSFRQKTRILGPDQETPVLDGKDLPVRLPSPAATATNVELFMNTTFPGEGTHWIEILLDGDLKVRFPLRVTRILPPAPPPPPEP